MMSAAVAVLSKIYCPGDDMDRSWPGVSHADLISMLVGIQATFHGLMQGEIAYCQRTNCFAIETDLRRTFLKLAKPTGNPHCPMTTSDIQFHVFSYAHHHIISSN